LELKQYLSIELNELDKELARVLNGLTQQEVAWKPACGCNSIGLILFHMAKIEDWFVQSKMQNKAEIWETEKWYDRLKLDKNEAGSNYTMEQVNTFQVSELKALLAYASAVRKETKKYLDSLNPAAFDSKITLSWTGEITLGAVFSILVDHAAQHIGEISYLRGLQRGLGK